MMPGPFKTRSDDRMFVLLENSLSHHIKTFTWHKFFCGPARDPDLCALAIRQAGCLVFDRGPLYVHFILSLAAIR